MLDGVSFATIDIGDVPAGLAEVDVHLDDNGEHFECIMMAGHVAYQAIGEQKQGIRPLPEWFMFTKQDQATVSDISSGCVGCGDIDDLLQPLRTNLPYHWPTIPGQKRATGARRYYPLDGIPTD